MPRRTSSPVRPGSARVALGLCVGAVVLVAAACLPVAPPPAAPATPVAAPNPLPPPSSVPVSTSATTTAPPPTTTAPRSTCGAGSMAAAAGANGSVPDAGVPGGKVVVALVRDGGGLRVERHAAGSAAEADALAQRLRERPDVAGAEVDGTVHAFAPDPYRAAQWALDRIPFEPTWAASPGSRGSGVTVAVVDSGVLGTHEDLDDGRVLVGCDFVTPGGGDGRVDPNGHGTFVAGLVAAESSNGVGISGAAPGVRILPVRVLDQNGSGSYSAVESGIMWATDHGAAVINLSLGGTSPSATLLQALQYATGKGVTVVMAAGNCGNATCNSSPSTVNPVMYPAAYSTGVPGAIAVGASAENDSIAAFSTHGPFVDLVGPGVAIVSTWGTGNDDYAQGDGTSFAAPYVAASVAILHAVCPADSPDQLRTRLESTATDLGAAGRDDFAGAGLVRPDLAVAAC